METIIKSIFLEPINLVLLLSIFIISLGFSINEIPDILVNFISRLKDTLTPLVLIFIGLSIIFARDSVKEIIPLLLLRAGICIFLTTLIISFFGLTNNNEVLFYLILSLSSVSFWPFAHMTLIDKIEKTANFKERTFDIGFGLNFLAYSLPFSTILILLFLSGGETLSSIPSLLILSTIMISLSLSLIFIKSKKQNILDKRKKRNLESSKQKHQTRNLSKLYKLQKTSK